MAISRVAAAALGTLLALHAASAAPGRHLDYAESYDRLVYAFVFGSNDTCRVIRRPSPPAFTLDDLLRRPPGPDYRGEASDKILAEFTFGRFGRPLHIVPMAGGDFLITFANRAPEGGKPAQDRIYHLKEKGYEERLEYAALPEETLPPWPVLARALEAPKAREHPPDPLSFAFVSIEPVPGRLLVARQSEGGNGLLDEFVCFGLNVPGREVELPRREELLRLLREDEPLFRAGAAWALGLGGDRTACPELREALGRTDLASARALLAGALVRCGDATARKSLRQILVEEKETGARRAAARALVTGKPERGDADALVGVLADGDGRTAELALLGLALLGREAWAAIDRGARAQKPEARAAAACALGWLDTREAEARLLHLVGDGDEAVQSAAAVALTSPPRTILPENLADFARALDAARLKKNKRAAHRLSVLARHAKLDHEKILKALVDLAPFHAEAIRSLAALTGQPLETPEACKEWWKARG